MTLHHQSSININTCNVNESYILSIESQTSVEAYLARSSILALNDIALDSGRNILQ